MDGLTLIREARNAGLCIAADGDRLVIRGPKRAEATARKLIDHKPIVLAILRRPIAERPPNNAAGSKHAIDWNGFYEERAAIRQYCGGYRRDLAEWLAWGEVIEMWCKRHPFPHDLGTCAGCGERLASDALELPDGTRVHWAQKFACFMAYGSARHRQATEALVACGLQSPTGRGAQFANR